MIFIWQGWGFLVFVIPIVLMILIQYIADAIYGAGYYSSNHICIFYALIISSIIIWFVGSRLNNKEQGRTMIDKATGQEEIFKRKHTAFWIPMQWFSPVLAAFAFFVLYK